MNLYSHQQKIIQENKDKVGIFLGTGGGKTRVALALARGKTLVICPKTQYEDQNWQREAQKMGLKIDLTVISKEKFRSSWPLLPHFDTVIADECHVLAGVTAAVRWRKGEQYPKASQLFEATQAYIKKNLPERLYLLTATPAKSPMAVWALGKLLGKNWDWFKFRDKFYIQLPSIGRNVYKARSDRKTKETIGELVRGLGYTGRLEEWFDFPESTYKTDSISLTKEQEKRIKEIPNEYPDPIVALGKIHQIENGVLGGDEYVAPESFKNEKIERILQYAEEFDKILIFAKYLAQIEAIKKALEKAGKKVLILTGATKERGNLISSANSNEGCIVIAQSQISLGYELPSFPCVIYASMSWSQVDLIQSYGRVQRANALKHNLYIYLVVHGKNSIDEAVFKTLMNKQDFHEKIYLHKVGKI